MSEHDGNRLARWRESLPRVTAKPIAARALSRAAGWEAGRWNALEKRPKWSPSNRREVERGLRSVLALTDTEIPDRVVAHVLDGAEPSAVGAWRDGQCPAAPMGRPLGTGRPLGPRVLPRHSDDDDPDDPSPRAARPIIPATLRRTQVDAVLRALEDGEVDRDTALALVVDIYEPLHTYYNKSDRHADDVA